MFLAYYLKNDIFLAATDMDFALIGSLNFSMAILSAPLFTILARRLGIHTPMSIGISLQASGFIAASYATRSWHLYLSQGILLGLGVGSNYIPSIAILSQRVQRRRSLANGIGGAGSGVGGLLISFVVRAAIGNLSLAWALRIPGLMSGFMNILATSVIRSRNHIIQPKQRPLDRALLRRYDVMLVLVWSFASMLGYIVLFFSMSDFARSIGLDDFQAAAVTAFLSLGTALGRPLIGIISDRFGRVEIAGFLTFICALSAFAIWLQATSYGVTILFAINNGAILGVFWVAGIHNSRTSSHIAEIHSGCWPNLYTDSGA